MLTQKDAILFKIVHTCAMMPKATILFKIVHTCAKECLILKYKYVQNPCYDYHAEDGGRGLTEARILDILILQDKTLFCACVDNFKQNGGFLRHCACADNFKQNGVFWRQHLPAVRVWTWPKYNKHHHDLKKQLCRFIDMYIGKIFWPTAPCRGCPEKEIWGQG